MKNFLCFLGLLIGLNVSLFAQNVKLTESEVATVLSKQWEIEFGMMGSEKIVQMPGAKDFDLLFKENGSLAMIDDDGTVRTGFWKYQSEDKYIELSVDGKITSRIISLNNSKLILILVSGKSESTRLPNVEIHFKPL